jgi:glycosyltransferase involved in cell wall biosynthesis
MCAMTGELRVLSVYEGFFTGGARILHSGVIAALHGRRGQHHSVLSIHRQMHRESLRQNMVRDASYRMLRAAGLEVSTLGRAAEAQAKREAFTPGELELAARYLAEAEIVVSLKEQPLRLITAPGLPWRPVVVCLHRSDPENQGQALSDLQAAVASGRVVAIVCCAESTRDAYAAAGIPSDLLHVVPNGADRKRFRPASAWTRTRLRRALGVPHGAPVVVFAARHDAMKNVPLFLRATREFLRREPTGEVIACGAGMSRANPLLREEIREAFGDEKALLARLHLLGVRKDMENIYRAADVVTLTSAVGEAAPLCLIEGMMSGAVPVATDVGDCVSIVQGRGLVAAPDPVAISEAWIEAVARREEFVAAAAADAERFSHRRMVRSYGEIISRLRGITPAALQGVPALTPA